MQRGVHRLHALLLGLCLLTLFGTSGTWAQTQPGATASTPATLRLAQVVPRLPITNFYAIAQTESGMPLTMRPADLSALIGSDRVPVSLSQEPDSIGIVFLIDISASLQAPQYELIKTSVRDWIDQLKPGDRAAIVTLGSSVNTVVDFTTDKATLKDAVGRLVFKDQQTLLYQGLVQAIDLSRRLDKNLPLRRAIVVLTDGLDDQEGGAGRQEVVDKLAIDPTPIYGIGASLKNNVKVDEALKDFASLVRSSGGDYRRIDVAALRHGYAQLQTIVNSTQHLTALCDGCTADGSAVVVRLFMSQGATSLSSGSVTVRAVGSEGRVEPPPPPPKPAVHDDPPQPVISPPVYQQPPHAQQTIWWAETLKFLMKHWQWVVVAVLALTGGIGGVFAMTRRPDPPDETIIIREPQVTRPAEQTVFAFKPAVEIPTGTQRHKQRLRLYPLGHNDLPAREALFEGELTLGRNEDRDICIFNDSQVSGSHCTLSPRNGRIFVRDDGSRNGTRVNGVPIEGFMHAEADSILGVGRTELRMQLLPAGRQ